MAALRKQTREPERRPTPAPPSSRGERLFWIITAAIAALFILTFTVPWQPASEAPIGTFDFSWMLLLHDAVATGRQFGTEIILPQGPLGFIGNSVYDPRTYWVLIAVRSICAIVAFWSIWEAARKLIARALLALPWMLAVILMIGATPDHFFPACALLLLMNYFVVHGRRLSRSAIALNVVLAASSLIKVNQPFYAIAVVCVLTVDQLLLRRRTFFIAPVIYVGAWLLFYLAARQRPSSLGPFIWGWWQVAVGHADAVGLPGAVVYPLIDPIAYLIVVVFVLALIARYEWKTRRFSGLLPLAGIAAVLLLLYKHSFMRHDLIHVRMGPMVVMAAAILYLPVIWPLGGRRLRGIYATMMVVAGLSLALILSRNTPRSLLGEILLAPVTCAENISAAMSHVTDPSRLNRECEAAQAQIRKETPLPLAKIEGTVDLYPHRQDVIFAYGLGTRYAPRPVVSSLVASSPTLTEINAHSLRGAGAPQTILFDVELVDRNFPTLLDSQTLPELLTRYDVIDSSGGMLVLRRAAKPRSFRFVPWLTQTGHFNEAIPIPSAWATPAWARIRFKKRLAGRIIAALYKPAWVGIAVHTTDGAEHVYRLLPSLAEQGFLLSPLLVDRMAYNRLATAKTFVPGSNPALVDAIMIVVEGGSQEASFEPDFEVELSRLAFQRQE